MQKQNEELKALLDQRLSRTYCCSSSELHSRKSCKMLQLRYLGSKVNEELQVPPGTKG